MDIYEVENSALHVNKGVKQPDITNAKALQNFKRKRKKQLSVNDYVKNITNGNRSVLSMAITLIESSLPNHQKLAQEIIEKCLPFAGKSIRIGITGVPGVGKSTFIETFGSLITLQNKKLAVLAIDPSSERTGGSILGDKTRMEKLSVDENAFIRPSPAAGSLGGVAKKTRESIILCEAAGFDTILIETVGVGQSETAVHSMVDFFLLLMLAGAGDELQGIKRGIMEMADAIAITKADGANINKSKLARIEYQNALRLFPPTASGWTPKVVTCSALESKRVEDIWKIIANYIDEHKDYISERRSKQAKYWMYETINENLRNAFYSNSEMKNKIKKFETGVVEGRLSPFAAAKSLLDGYFG